MYNTLNDETASQPAARAELYIHLLDHPLLPGTRLSQATHELIWRQRKMLAALIVDALGLRLDPRLRLRGCMVLIDIESSVLVPNKNDVRFTVQTILGDVGRFAGATETINVSRLGGDDASRNSGTLREAEQQLEALHVTKTATGRSVADIAMTWLQTFCRVQEQIMFVGIPSGPEVQIVIPVRQRVVPTRTMGAPVRRQHIRYAGQRPRLVSPCIVVRTTGGRKIVVPASGPVPTLSVGSRVRVTTEELRRANYIDVLRAARPDSDGGRY